MSDKYRRIAGLIIKRRYEVASPAELRELEEWGAESAGHAALLSEWLAGESLQPDPDFQFPASGWKEGWRRLQKDHPLPVYSKRSQLGTEGKPF